MGVLYNYENKLYDGINLYKCGKYNELINLFKDIDSWEGSVIKAKAFYYKGQAYYATYKYNSAIDCFETVINYSKNTEILDLINNSYYYKASALYALQSYKEAIESFEFVPDKSTLAICANLYKGFCYEYLKEYGQAEECFNKVEILYQTSEYPDKDNILSKSHRALIQSLIKQEKFNDLIEKYKEDIDKFDDAGNTLLMYATSNHKFVLVDMLLKANANPFLTDKFGTSAFSIALMEKEEDLAKKFIQTKYEEIIHSPSLIGEIIPHLYSTQNGDFSYYIASNIGNKSSSLRDLLQLNDDAAQACFSEAKEYCEALGIDTSNLSINDSELS